MRTLAVNKPPRISMVGSLTARLKPWLADDIKAKLAEPINPPEVGAVFFACQQLLQ